MKEENGLPITLLYLNEHVSYFIKKIKKNITSIGHESIVADKYSDFQVLKQRCKNIIHKGSTMEVFLKE